MTDPREALARIIFDAGARCGSTNALCPCEEWDQSPMCREVVRDYADAILAAGWTRPGERVQCDHERAAREMARVTPLRVGDTLRMIEAMVKLGPPTAQPSVKDVARVIARRWNMSPRNKPVLDDARAVLALLPGRTEAEVKAEALDEAAYAAVTDEEGIAWDDDYDRATVGAWLGERAEQARGESRNG